jgi:hypothetical protein
VELEEGTVRADSGPAEFTGGGALIDAFAVFAESEEVGGPEENIDRFGVVKIDVEEVWPLRSKSDVKGMG